VKRAGVLAAALVLSACGGQPVTKCTGALTGGFTRTFEGCNSFVQAYRDSLDSFLLRAGHDETGAQGESSYSLASEILMQGQPSQGQMVSPECRLSLSAAANKWTTKANTGTSVVIGTCGLAFTDVVPDLKVDNTITYCLLRGTLDADLVQAPGTPAESVVTLSLQFEVGPAVGVAADKVLEEQRRVCCGRLPDPKPAACPK